MVKPATLLTPTGLSLALDVELGLVYGLKLGTLDVQLHEPDEGRGLEDWMWVVGDATGGCPTAIEALAEIDRQVALTRDALKAWLAPGTSPN